jgi:hypothetical protein
LAARNEELDRRIGWQVMAERREPTLPLSID